MIKNRETDSDELILRDDLAVDRSKLANERTLLAYVRTGLMFFVSGLSLIKLFPTEIILVSLGYVLMPISVLISIWGVIRFKRTCEIITRSYEMKKVY